MLGLAVGEEEAKVSGRGSALVTCPVTARVRAGMQRRQALISQLGLGDQGPDHGLLVSSEPLGAYIAKTPKRIGSGGFKGGRRGRST